MPLKSDHDILHPFIPQGGPTHHCDLPGVRIGVAEYVEGPTGCTVFCLDNRPLCAIYVRGSSALFIGRSGPTDIICLTGGSTYGLAAIAGTAQEFLVEHHYHTHWNDVARVAGAVIYDFRPRSNAVFPDVALGRAAFRAARSTHFPLGAHGAGCSASVGKLFQGLSLLEPSGQGAASAIFQHIPIAVYTVVNAVGAVFDHHGAVAHGFLDFHSHHHLSLTDQLARVTTGEELHPPDGNTTLTVVFVGQRLELYELDQLARQVHSSLARAIQPFHAAEDGDVLFAVSLPLVSNQRLPVSLLGAAVSEVAWHAVLACWPSAVAT